MGRSLGSVLTATLLLALITAGGCDRKPDRPAVPTAPPAPAGTSTSTPAPATTRSINAAATAPATRAAANDASVIEIAGEPYFFPAARLRVEAKDDAVRARLYSNDPPTALSKSYSGNFYYFDIPLDIKDPADIAQAQWTFKATGREQEDSPNGIFLEGMKKQLQPYDATITFTRAGNMIMTRVAGKFLLFGEDQSEARTVNVDGVLTSAVQGK